MRDNNNSSSSSFLWVWVFLPLCISWRVFLANRMPITDCDEVYNYWEPLHFLLYGSGMQTWEYAHQYALRTYAYLLPLAGISFIYEKLLGLIPSALLQTALGLLVDLPQDVLSNLSSKFTLFLLLRCSLAGWMAYAEVRFCQALEERQIVSWTVARFTLFVLQTSAGLAHASGALLPSTTWAVAWLLSATCLLQQQPKWFVLYAVTATLAIGWPFGVLILVPLGLYVLFGQTKTLSGPSNYVQAMALLLIFAAAISILIQALVMMIDFQQYGDWTSPTLNIFRYNAQGGGDELYGVEPLSYYIKNLLLNFNGVTVFAALSIVTTMFSAACSYMSSPQQRQNQNGLTKILTSAHDKRNHIIVLIFISVIYLWLVVVVPRPHKEERFLFPIYPIICFSAVVSLDVHLDMLFGLLGHLTNIKATPTSRGLLHASVWIPMAALSLMRAVALHKYYGAPLAIYAVLHSYASTGTTTKPQLVCTCGEWYRFPSSFTLPDNHQLAFLPCSFMGQLPQPFSKYGSSVESRTVMQPFNDQNQHEPTRYSAVDDCAYVIDLQESSDCRVAGSARILATAPFLDAEKTISTLHRTLYIPKLHEDAIAKGTVHYQNYVVYKL